MGVFLDKPKKEKETEDGEGNGLRYALCSMQGWRVEMEDSHSVNIGLTPSLQDCSFFAVFDGHAGDYVSKYSSEHLLETILEVWHPGVTNKKQPDSNPEVGEQNDSEMKSPKEEQLSLIESTELENFKEKVIEGFLKIDSNMRNLPKFSSGVEKSGTTAVATFVTPSKVIFANCGDSRALLCSKKNIKFVTSDHKPYNEEEKSRIENAGGSVMIQRVNGSLAVSRALGDYDYKNSPSLPATMQLVSPEPDLDIIERSVDDEFLILACDGIWDVMSNQEVVDYITSRLLVHSDLKKVCEELLETCLAKGSRDNMSVIIVTFPSAPQVNEEALAKENVLNETIKDEVQKMVKEYGDGTTLNMVCEGLQSSNLPNLPPGGGIQSKISLIEETLDSLMPDREEQRSMLSSLPVPLSMLRHFAQSENAENMSGEENADDQEKCT